MRIQVQGPGAESLMVDLTTAGIPFERVAAEYRPGIYNASLGEFLEFLSTPAPWGAVAAVLVTWLRIRSKRDVMITTADDKLIHLTGYSEDDVVKLLKVAKTITALDVNKPNDGSDDKVKSKKTKG